MRVSPAFTFSCFGGRLNLLREAQVLQRRRKSQDDLLYAWDRRSGDGRQERPASCIVLSVRKGDGRVVGEPREEDMRDARRTWTLVAHRMFERCRRQQDPSLLVHFSKSAMVG